MSYNKQYHILIWIILLVFKYVKAGDFWHSDLSKLDEVQICQVQFMQNTIEEDTHLEFLVNNADSEYFSLFSNVSEKCQNTLIVQPLEELVSDLQSVTDCEEEMHFIKDPFSTLLFTAKALIIPNDLYTKWPCLYPLQPYFFLLVDYNESNSTLFEIQIYSKSIQPVGQFIGSELKHFVDIYERRKHFNGTKLRIHFDNYNPDGYIVDERFVGYNGDLFGILQQTMNFTLVLNPIQMYGVQLPNGSFSGTIRQLHQSETDIAIASYTQLPSRLEVVDPLFITRRVKNVLFYWKNQNVSTTLYIAVFSRYFWCLVVLTTFLSTLYLSLLIIILKTKKTYSILIPIKSLGLLDFDLNFNFLSLKVFTLSVVFTSSLLYWCYSGSLISYLTNDNDSPPFNRFEDLLEMPDFKLLMMEGAAPTQTLLSAAQRNDEMNKVLERNVLYMSSQNYLEAFTQTYSPGTPPTDAKIKICHQL